MPESEKHYISYENRQYYLFSSPERYINYSCEASTNPMNKCDAAIKDIKKREELTTDYSKDNNPRLNIKCNCKSKNCKGVIKNNQPSSYPLITV